MRSLSPRSTPHLRALRGLRDLRVTACGRPHSGASGDDAAKMVADLDLENSPRANMRIAADR